MLIDEIRKAKIQAMKDHDEDKKNAFSMVLTRYQVLKTTGKEDEIGDAEVLAILKKFAKELDEEAEGYKAADREDSYRSTLAQKEAISAFLPKQMSEEEIKAEILSLSDRSIPSVMKHFKANHAGEVDMGLVSKIARSLQ